MKARESVTLTSDDFFDTQTCHELRLLADAIEEAQSHGYKVSKISTETNPISNDTTHAKHSIAVLLRRPIKTDQTFSEELARYRLFLEENLEQDPIDEEPEPERSSRPHKLEGKKVYPPS